MPIVAIVSRKPSLELGEWVRLIQSRPELTAPPVREIVNPFTQRPAVVHPREGRVQIHIASNIVGGIEPSDDFERDGELLVYAREETLDDAFRTLVADLAASLEADVQWIPL